MELLTGTDIDFLGRRNFFLGVSLTAVLVSVGLVAVRGLNYGIEFAGGTEVELRFRDAPRAEKLRRRLAEARRLLEETDRPVTQICLDVGFQSPGSFSTLFRAAVGPCRTACCAVGG